MNTFLSLTVALGLLLPHVVKALDISSLITVSCWLCSQNSLDGNHWYQSPPIASASRGVSQPLMNSWRRVRWGEKRGRSRVFLGRCCGWDTCDSLTFSIVSLFPLHLSSRLRSAAFPGQGVRVCLYFWACALLSERDKPQCGSVVWVFSEAGARQRAPEHWGVSLRGPVGLNAWHLGAHINLNEGTKWQACDLDRPLKLTVTCFPQSWWRSALDQSAAQVLWALMDRWLISSEMLTFSISRRGWRSAPRCQRSLVGVVIHICSMSASRSALCLFMLPTGDLWPGSDSHQLIKVGDDAMERSYVRLVSGRRSQKY